jgi:hypothetical protein
MISLRMLNLPSREAHEEKDTNTRLNQAVSSQSAGFIIVGNCRVAHQRRLKINSQASFRATRCHWGQCQVPGCGKSVPTMESYQEPGAYRLRGGLLVLLGGDEGSTVD